MPNEIKAWRESETPKGRPTEAQANLESNAEYQRRRVMSRDDRAFEARDRLAKNIKEQNERDGRGDSYERAHRKATEIAERDLRRRQEHE